MEFFNCVPFQAKQRDGFLRSNLSFPIDQLISTHSHLALSCDNKQIIQVTENLFCVTAVDEIRERALLFWQQRKVHSITATALFGSIATLSIVTLITLKIIIVSSVILCTAALATFFFIALAALNFSEVCKANQQIKKWKNPISQILDQRTEVEKKGFHFLLKNKEMVFLFNEQEKNRLFVKWSQEFFENYKNANLTKKKELKEFFAINPFNPEIRLYQNKSLFQFEKKFEHLKGYFELFSDHKQFLQKFSKEIIEIKEEYRIECRRCLFPLSLFMQKRQEEMEVSKDDQTFAQFTDQYQDFYDNFHAAAELYAKELADRLDKDILNFKNLMKDKKGKIAYFSKEIQQFSFAYLEKKETYKATFFNFSTEFPDQEKIHCFIFSSISNVGKKLHPAIEEYKDFQIWLNKKDSNEFLNKSCF